LKIAVRVYQPAHFEARASPGRRQRRGGRFFFLRRVGLGRIEQLPGSRFTGEFLHRLIHGNSYQARFLVEISVMREVPVFTIMQLDQQVAGRSKDFLIYGFLPDLVEIGLQREDRQDQQNDAA